MKLRLDLLKHLTAEDVQEEILANNPRYRPEPLFCKTGTGSLSSASTEQRAQEVERSTALIEKLKERAAKTGKLRLDLLKHLTAEDIAEQAEAATHRFKPEPLFSQTGVGTLSSASTEESAQEVAHSMDLTRKLEQRAAKTGTPSGSES